MADDQFSLALCPQRPAGQEEDHGMAHGMAHQLQHFIATALDQVNLHTSCGSVQVYIVLHAPLTDLFTLT